MCMYMCVYIPICVYIYVCVYISYLFLMKTDSEGRRTTKCGFSCLKCLSVKKGRDSFYTQNSLLTSSEDATLMKLLRALQS